MRTQGRTQAELVRTAPAPACSLTGKMTNFTDVVIAVAAAIATQATGSLVAKIEG